MTAATRRILYVEGNVDGTVGGSYYSLFFLATGLDRSRFHPIVCFATETPFRDRLRSEGIDTIVVQMTAPFVVKGPLGRIASKAANFLLGLLVEPMRLARLLRKLDVSLLHLNNSITRNHPWMIAARMAGIPCITHERGINESFSTRSLWLARTLKAVICISAAVRDNFQERGLGDLPLVTIYNGLDPAAMTVSRGRDEILREFGIPAGARVTGIIGNIKPWKGQEVVIRAIAMLRTEFPDLHCLLIGDTAPDQADYRTSILDLIRELDLAERVFVTGFRADVANYVAALDIQIHASIAPEPFGRVLLEGMALAKPLVASGGGAVPEIVENGRSGLLFEPGSPAALADALRRLLLDPAAAVRMGQAGRERLEQHFSIRNNVAQTESLYERLLG